MDIESMKVVHVIARFNVGGTATWIGNLSKSLVREGHESYVLAGVVQTGETQDPRFEEINGIRIGTLGRKIALWSDLKSILEIRKIIKELSPDVINTHTAKAGVIGRLAAFSLGRNRPAVVHTIHGHLLIGYFGQGGTRLVTLIERFMSRITDVMLFAGERVKEDCLAHGISHQKASFIVMPGVSIVSSKKRSGQSITVGWLARFAVVKRPERVLEVAHQLPEVNFVLGGDGPLREEMQSAASENCAFLGWVAPENFWSQVDIALLTSDNEALPISLIEAQLCGLPSVCTPAGSAPEVVVDQVNGFVAKTFDSSELSKLVRELVTNSRLREKMGSSAQQRAEQMFSLNKQVKDHLKAYSTAIEIRARAKNE
jgi:glycosyltransferase involved in cell wall biosynthesis